VGERCAVGAPQGREAQRTNAARAQRAAFQLDGLIESYGLPTFCKIDVEGYEAEVLAGLSQPVAGLSVEFVAGQLGIAEACVARLEELGTYDFNVVRGEERALAFDAWRTAGEILAWLRAGADQAASGDIYAVLDRA
jgi:hypothetical protein